MSQAEVASNLRSGANPSFSSDDFLALYPQFATVPPNVLEMYVTQANACILKARWKSQWVMGISLYIAHYLTLYLRCAVQAGATNKQISESGMPRGTMASKSVGGVSVTYSATNANTELSGWGSYKDTSYGQQFATIARLVGRGGMYVI